MITVSLRTEMALLLGRFFGGKLAVKLISLPVCARTVVRRYLAVWTCISAAITAGLIKLRGAGA